jgi:hypothetical protein
MLIKYHVVAGSPTGILMPLGDSIGLIDRAIGLPARSSNNAGTQLHEYFLNIGPFLIG